MTHTQGKWEYVPTYHTFDDGVKAATYAIIDDNKNFVAKLHPINGEPQDIEQVSANARLIAAAPDMLATLYKAIAVISNPEAQGVVDEIRNLINKIEGK